MTKETRKTRKEKLHERNELIRKAFKKDTTVNHLDAEHVCSELGALHTLEADTIWMIVLKQGRYK